MHKKNSVQNDDLDNVFHGRQKSARCNRFRIIIQASFANSLVDSLKLRAAVFADEVRLKLTRETVGQSLEASAT